VDTLDRRALVEDTSGFVEPLRAEIARVIVGQSRLVDGLLIGLLTDGHVLIEGVPGLAKTLAVKTLAAALALTSRRIQFTPDLLPADVIGTLVYNPRTSDFQIHKGPVFANIVLADEINRAPAKVQSALLEAMQERRVTLGDTTYALGDPFLVLATQNPIEHEGTYPLPEAQLDRFLMQVSVDYPSRTEELEILRRNMAGTESPVLQTFTTSTSLTAAKQALGHVQIDSKIQGYVLDIVRSTRPTAGIKDVSTIIRHGASPRAAVHLGLAARAHAFLARRPYVVPEDVKDVAAAVLGHRLLLSYDAEADNVSPREIIERLLTAVPVP
jgi:MoxR-like ATPase